MTEPRKAKVCARELCDEGSFLHIELDEQLVRLAVPLDVASRARLGVEVEVPDGDITHPLVQAGIRWAF